MEYSVDLLNAIAKRGWKIVSWIIPTYIIFLLALTVIMYSSYPLLFLKLNINKLEFIKFIISQLFTSFIILFLFYILKGDTKSQIRELRKNFYRYCINRTKKLFSYRFDNNSTIEPNEFIKLSKYTNTYKNNSFKHIINISYLKYKIIDEIDSLYFIYKIQETKQYILFSVWHTGEELNVAIAFERNYTNNNKDKIMSTFKSALNLSNSTYDLGIRDKYYWFDIKYKISKDFLVSNVEQENFSRKVSHIVTIGINASMELIGWTQDLQTENPSI